MALALARNACGNRGIFGRFNISKALLGPQMGARTVVMRPTPVVPEKGVFNHDDRNDKLGRPMSPYLGIYKYQVTSMLSINHRFTGVMLTGWGMIMGYGSLIMPHDMTYYLTALENLHWSAPALYGLKLFMAFPFAYHACNGLRHLSWDAGKNLEIKQVYSTGYFMLGTAIIIGSILAAL
uniref:CSON010824 protein n=1 Tax=Culicoides sonorensis TaxID=179676 RepID=A0A336M7W1_CULSO